ncbi:calcium permeable stress-gated cation channel 1 [Fusarium heterosporum]|uniref:Calcium permeable stress-gated cation channel 1 n=1 Tax=Fusarium heterosporum TaxID=42747 RepID=A0A8H5WD07_FUSHE|nr:calcium permeable stress-gated cation channel 1 [Fusarium heterosporum]
MMNPKRGDVTVNDLRSQGLFREACHIQSRQGQDYAGNSGQCISTSNITDHYRAVPLIDGHRVLYTDPRTGTLSLGSKAPTGSPNRLICQAHLRPPTDISSSLPVLYTAASDRMNGVCVAATFSVIGGDDALGEHADAMSSDVDPLLTSDMDRQTVVIFTIPHDLLAVTSGSLCRQHCLEATQYKNESEQMHVIDGRPKGSCSNIDFPDGPSAERATHPIEIRGQAVAICRNLVELALNSGPDMVLWAFGAQGWTRAWALRAGCKDELHRTVVQADGTLRHVDSKGDYIMTELDQTVPELDVTFELLANLEMVLQRSTDPAAQVLPATEQYYGFSTSIPGEDNKRTVSLEFIDGLRGITRVSVELD